MKERSLNFEIKEDRGACRSSSSSNKHIHVLCQDPCLEYHFGGGNTRLLTFTGLINFFLKKISFSNTFLVLRKTILASHLRYKKGIILVSDAVSANEFLLETKNLWMKGVFLDDRRNSPMPSLKKFGKCW